MFSMLVVDALTMPLEQRMLIYYAFQEWKSRQYENFQTRWNNEYQSMQNS
jgi:hypothetical protein